MANIYDCVDSFIPLLDVEMLGLPTDGILVPIDERKKVVKNFEEVVSLLKQEDVTGAVYISKIYYCCFIRVVRCSVKLFMG